MHTPPLDAFIAEASQLTPQSVDRLASFYAEHCEFQDPFQTVQGRAAVAAVYQNMFEQLHGARFTNVRLLGGADTASGETVIGWDFQFALGKHAPPQVIAECGLLRWNAEGKVHQHIDYWDASQLMQGLPVVGRVIGWLRQKIGQAH